MKNGKREILVGAVGLVKGSLRHGGKAMSSVCDELEPEFEESGFLNDAPFKTVSIILRYGTKWGQPIIGRINNRHSELEVAIELPMSELRSMDESNLAVAVKKASLESLIATAEKYDLDKSIWVNKLASIS